MSVVFIYIGIVYIIPTIEGNVSIRGFLCAQECTFGDIYICIGYMLPILWGIYVSWRVSVRPSGAKLRNVHVVICVSIHIFLLDICCQNLEVIWQ